MRPRFHSHPARCGGLSDCEACREFTCPNHPFSAASSTWNCRSWRAGTASGSGGESLPYIMDAGRWKEDDGEPEGGEGAASLCSIEPLRALGAAIGAALRGRRISFM